MKLPNMRIIAWWRTGMVASGIVLAGLIFFSFLVYQRVNMIARQPSLLRTEEEEPSTPFLSSELRDDMNVFWGKRTGEGDEAPQE